MTSTEPLRRDALLSRDVASRLDDGDPLGAFRDRFRVPIGTIYLDGNSLGLPCRDAEAAIHGAIGAWRTFHIDGWTHGDRPWFWIGERLGEMQSGLVGAFGDEVVVTGGTTTNLHGLVSTFYRPVGSRTRIVTDATTFPSDRYALASQVALRGLDPETHLVAVGEEDRGVDEDELVAALGPDVAFAWFNAVDYRTGRLLDMERLARECAARGIPIGLDLAHSVGALPHRLHDWGVDCATWCTYKYLNGGPGAVGALFVHRRHHGTVPALVGWWGYDKSKQFDMSAEFVPAPSAGAWQVGTPSVLGAAALYGSLAVANEAGIERVRAKSLALTGLLLDLVDSRLSPFGFASPTPRDPARRGGHVAVTHPQAASIVRALKARGVVPDFRPPNIVRLAPVAFYTRFVEVWDAVEVLADIGLTDAHRDFANERGVVA
jgi:kynureninase